MIPLKEFVNELRNSRETSLLVISCSKTKRSDEDIKKLFKRRYCSKRYEKRKLKRFKKNKEYNFDINFEDREINFYSKTMELEEDQRISLNGKVLKLIVDQRISSDTEILELRKEISFDREVLKLRKNQQVSSYRIWELLKDFRKCSQECHPKALKPSKDFPAYLRYKGRFYKVIWRRGGIKIWKKVVEDGWKVLILSAFYGFLRITDPIGNYDLRLSNLNDKCKKLLPEILKVIVDTNNIKRVYFLTSKEYSEPFRGKLPNLYRVVLLDGSRKEIIGNEYKEYFSEAGEFFAYLIYGGKPPTRTRYIKLERV